MSLELSTFLLILGLSSSLASSINEKSCKKVCITVNACATGKFCDDFTGPKYSKCQIKCNRNSIIETIEKIELNNLFNNDEKPNLESRNDVTDDDELREEFKELLRVKLQNRKKDYDIESKYKGPGDDGGQLAVMVAEDKVHPGNVEFLRQTLNMANKMSLNGQSAYIRINPYKRVQNTASKITVVYPDLFSGLFDTNGEEYLRNYLHKFVGDENVYRGKNWEIFGVQDKSLGLLSSPLEKSRRIKRTLLPIGLGAGAGGSTASGVGGRIGGSIGGGIGLGPGGLTARLSGSASGEASGYTQGSVGAGAGAGLGAPAYGYPGAGYPAMMGRYGPQHYLKESDKNKESK